MDIMVVLLFPTIKARKDGMVRIEQSWVYWN
jgi:hypothetical protein